MTDCSNTPTPEATSDFGFDTRCFSEVMTSNDDYTTSKASDGKSKKTLAAALRDAGQEHVGEWSTNPEVTASNQVIPYAGTNQLFRPLSLPYQVDSVTNPNPNALLPDPATGYAGELVDVSQFLTSSSLSEYANLSFATVAEAEASTILSLGDRIETRFNNAEIVQQWEVVSADPSPEYGRQVAKGLWLKEVSNLKFFESFGAFGNGADSDNDAFTFAKSYNGLVLGKPKATYNVSVGFDLTNSARWKGQWCKVNLTGSEYFATVGTNCYLGDFDVDGLNEDHTAYPIAIATPSENAQLGDMKYRNMHGKTSFQTYPCKIPLYGAKGFTVGHQKFFNILQDDDGAVTGKGFVGGVYFVGVDSEFQLGKSHGTVEAIYGDGIRSVDAGAGVVQDSDLLRFFCETEDNTPFDIVIGPVIGRNVHKRIVKGGSISGVKIGDVYSFNEDQTNPYSLFAAVEALGTANDFEFGNVHIEGPSQRAVWLKGEGNSCGNVFDGAGCQAVILGGPGQTAVSCQVGDITGRGDNTSPQGTGVTMFNADLCQTGNITGLFAVSYDSNQENIGKNTVGDITCNGRLNSQYGDTSFGAINTDITSAAVAGSHYILGGGTRLTTCEIKTDGRVTMSVTGSGCDIDLGSTRIVRTNANNGEESNHSVFTTASATDGMIKGKLDIEVNASIAGTPSGSAGRTLAYFNTVDVDGLDLSLKVTASTRGATGLNVWFNTVNGQASRVAIKSAMSLVGSKFDGNLCIDKLENLVGGGSAVNCTGEVNAPIVEKRADGTISGLANTPITINSTR